MAKYLSPGVRVQERDLSTIVPAVATSTGALVGYSKKGPLAVTLVTNRQQFLELYGKPDIQVSYFHHTALAFLEKGTRLYCKRVTGDSPLYAGATIVTQYGLAHRAHDVGQSSQIFYDESGYFGYGDDIVTNGTFVSESGWTIGDDWALGSGEAAFAYVSDDTGLSQANALMEVGKSYLVTFIISESTLGSGSSVNVSLGTAQGTLRTAVGTYSEVITCTGNTTIGVNLAGAGAGDSVTIQSLQVQEVLSDDELISVFAVNPGEWGDNIKVTISDAYGLVDDNGNTLDTVDQYTFTINVYYTDSEGNTNKVESWKVSRKRKVDGYGKQLYLVDKINGYSNYIYVADSAQADTVLPLESDSETYADATALGGGDDGEAVAAADIVGATGAGTGWYAFENPDDIDVQILIDGGFTPELDAVPSSIAAIQVGMVAVAEARRDCIAILSVPSGECATNAQILAYRNSTLNANSSYAALYAPWCKVNDAYNDVVVEVPPSGYVAGHYALTDNVRDVWYAPAGFDRGTLNVLGLTYVFTEGERDILYPAGVNCLQTFRGYGNVIYGQKTLQKKASALDRVNVRRLLLSIEKAVVLLLRSFLFEPNSDLIRFIVKATIDEYMERLYASGAFQSETGDKGYLVICDTTNNTPEVIDANELHVDIFVKPSRAAEFIELRLTVTKTGTSFTELVSRGTIF